MRQHVATCDNMCALNTTCGKMWPLCENPVCPDPVWKPVTLEELLFSGGRVTDDACARNTQGNVEVTIGRAPRNRNCLLCV